MLKCERINVKCEKKERNVKEYEVKLNELEVTNV